MRIWLKHIDKRRKTIREYSNRLHVLFIHTLLQFLRWKHEMKVFYWGKKNRFLSPERNMRPKLIENCSVDRNKSFLNSLYDFCWCIVCNCLLILPPWSKQINKRFNFFSFIYVFRFNLHMLDHVFLKCAIRHFLLHFLLTIKINSVHKLHTLR